MAGPLDGRLALVTGASRGIGAATALALARAGAHVVLVARTVEALEAVEDRIHEAGGSATIAPLDLVDGDSIDRLAHAIGRRWEALDLLVLNAATLGTLGPVAQIDAKEFGRLLTLNVGAGQAMVAAFDPLLRRSSAGRVIGLTSSVGAAPRAYWGAYGASKAALDTLLLAYSDEVADSTPIRVAIVDPGATATQMRQRAFPGEDQVTLKPPEVVGEAIATLAAQAYPPGHRVRING